MVDDIHSARSVIVPAFRSRPSIGRAKENRDQSSFGGFVGFALPGDDPQVSISGLQFVDPRIELRLVEIWQ
jgi:hypothetical protein